MTAISLRLPDELLLQITEWSKKLGITKTALIEQSIKKNLEEQEREDFAESFRQYALWLETPEGADAKAEDALLRQSNMSHTSILWQDL